MSRAVGDELVDDPFGEFDEQVTGSPVMRREESTVDPQTRQAHHRGPRDTGPIQQWGSMFPETVFVVVWRVDVHNTNIAT